MKMIVIRNYWLMIISWCLFLNGKENLALILGGLACIYILINRKDISAYRVVLLGLVMFILSCITLLSSNIPYFFPKLHILLMIVSINTAIANEYISSYKNSFILPVLFISLVSILISLLLVMILPDILYSLFTKRSLLIMVSFIFLPYTIPLAYAAIKNAFKYKKDDFFQKQGAIN